MVFWAISRHKAWEGALNHCLLNSREFVWLPLDGQCPAQHWEPPTSPKKGGDTSVQKGNVLVFLWCQSPHSQGMLPQTLPAPGSWGGSASPDPIWVSSASPLCLTLGSQCSQTGLSQPSTRSIGSIHSLSAGNKCVKLQPVEEGSFLLPVIRSLSHNLLHRQKIIFHKPCFRSVIHSTDCTWPKPFQ